MKEDVSGDACNLQSAICNALLAALMMPCGPDTYPDAVERLNDAGKTRLPLRHSRPGELLGGLRVEIGL